MKNKKEKRIRITSEPGDGLGCMFALIGLSILILTISGQLITVLKIIFK